MSDGVAPSKGAMKAAQATLDIIDERITFFAYEKEKPKNLEMVAEIIDRETKSPQMVALLRTATAKEIAEKLRAWANDDCATTQGAVTLRTAADWIEREFGVQP